MDAISHQSWSALVIANDVQMQWHLNGLLRDAGILPTSIQSDQDGIYVLDEHHFDILLIDAGIPGISMQALCERVRALYGNNSIIIAIVGRNQNWLRIQSLYLGADDCVSNDCHGKELFARVYARMRRLAVLAV